MYLLVGSVCSFGFQSRFCNLLRTQQGTSAFRLRFCHFSLKFRFSGPSAIGVLWTLASSSCCEIPFTPLTSAGANEKRKGMRTSVINNYALNASFRIARDSSTDRSCAPRSGLRDRVGGFISTERAQDGKVAAALIRTAVGVIWDLGKGIKVCREANRQNG